MSGSETSSNASFITYKRDDLDFLENTNMFNFARSQQQSGFEDTGMSYGQTKRVAFDMQDDMLKTLLSQSGRSPLVNHDPCTMPDDLRDELMRQKRKDDAFKTALCDAFRRNQECSYGDQCRFAHGVHELRVQQNQRGRNHPKYKTVLCDKFSTTGVCKYGTRCQFIHKSVNSSYFTSTNEIRDKSSAGFNQSLFMPPVTADLSMDFNRSLPFYNSDIARAFARPNQPDASVNENFDRLTRALDAQFMRNYLRSDLHD